MHRTQIVLEDAQYVALRERARRSGKSMGAIIRALLDRELSAQAARLLREPEGLYSLQGAAHDAGFSAKDHDAALYGEER